MTDMESYRKGFYDGMSVDKEYPQRLMIMEYSFEQIIDLIVKDRERKEKMTPRERFKEALSHSGIDAAEFIKALSAYDKVHQK